MSNDLLTPRGIMRRLERTSAISLELPADIMKEKFQKQLSQAKVRMGIPGKLAFEWLPTKEGEPAVLSLVLIPSANTVIATVREIL